MDQCDHRRERCSVNRAAAIADRRLSIATLVLPSLVQTHSPQSAARDALVYAEALMAEDGFVQRYDSNTEHADAIIREGMDRAEAMVAMLSRPADPASQRPQ
jgi:hypothetical protein